MFMIILLTAILATGYSWEMNTTHTNVLLKLTDDVTFCCACNPLHTDTMLSIDHITRIRILKLHDGDRWKDVAEIVLSDESQPILDDPTIPDITVSANLGKLNGSYLSVTWPTASETTVGTYKCEVDGFSEGKDAHVFTNIVKVTSSAPTVSNLVDVILSMRQETKKTSEGLANIEKQLKLREELHESKILNKVRSMMTENVPEVQYWPSGHYALMSPATGCPSTPKSTMATGSATIESLTSSRLSHKLPQHFYDDVYERSGSQNTLHFRFCKGPSSSDKEVTWPKGSYCVHCEKNSNCPSGFNYGYIKIYLKSSSSLTYKENVIKDTVNCGTYAKDVYFNFCCRNDGDANIPIPLPNNNPFYLSRYKGKCQAVKGMNVTDETMVIDTDAYKTDKYDNSFNPDSELNDFKLHLCYYKPTPKLLF